MYRGSTVVFPSAAAANDDWREEAGYTYGLFGTPTTRELAARIGQLEHGRWTFLTPCGQASIALIYLSSSHAGDHVLVPDSVYGPNREFATGVLRRNGIDVEFSPAIRLDLRRCSDKLLDATVPVTTVCDVRREGHGEFGHANFMGALSVAAR